MPLVVVITRDVEDRYRGFLGSTMLELAPGVYAQPRMSKGVRLRIQDVLADWHGRLGRGSIVMCWAETGANGGLGLTTFGEPPKSVIAHEPLLLVRRALPPGERKHEESIALTS
jgi:CRISPR-associated protein Cas2